MQPAGRRPVVDVALQGGGCRSASRPIAPRFCSGCGSATSVFRYLTRAAAIVVLLILGGIIVSLVIGAWPALRDVRLRLPHQRQPGIR